MAWGEEIKVEGVNEDTTKRSKQSDGRRNMDECGMCGKYKI